MEEIEASYLYPKFQGMPTKRESIAVVGGGISAGQVALRLQKQGNEFILWFRT